MQHSKRSELLRQALKALYARADLPSAPLSSSARSELLQLLGYVETATARWRTEIIHAPRADDRPLPPCSLTLREALQ